jgi:uncharacterized membrane protein
MGLSNALRNSFVTGFVLVLPLLVTLFILRFIYNFLLQFVDPIVQETDLATYTANVELVAQGVTVVLIITTITFIGFLAQQRTGKRLFGSAGQVVTLIPLVRTIYTSVRQMADSLGSRDSSFEQLVLVEYPRKDVYMIGLVTGESPRPARDVVGGGARNVFVPSSPNPTNGRLLLVPDDQIHDVDLTTRQGMRLLMTTGMTSRDDTEYPLPDIDEELQIANMSPEPVDIDGRDATVAGSEAERDDESE